MKGFSILKKNVPFFILIVLAIFTRFLFLSSPAEVVFDEVHFGKFVSAYLSGEYYFDIHPPLGKLMIAGFYKIFGHDLLINSEQIFEKIGESFSAQSLFILRFLPALFGTLLVILIYKFILALGLSKKFALLGGFLILLENAFLVESKFILTDIFLIFFGFLSLYFFVLANPINTRSNSQGRLSTGRKNARSPACPVHENSQKVHRISYSLLAGIFAGLSFSVKWTGLSFLGIILFFSFVAVLQNFGFKKFFKRGGLLSFGKKFVFFIVVSLSVYLLIFFVHFKLLPKSGPGDAFMSREFQLTLEENKISPVEGEKSLRFGKKFIELNKTMYTASANLEATHPSASRWYQWPVMKKPIWYWSKNADKKAANIQLFGNPLIWWLICICVPFGLFSLLVKKIRRKILPQFNFLIFGFLINLLPFISIERVTFLYHYLPSLIFGILILLLLLEKIPQAYQFNLSPKFLIGFLFLVLITFVAFTPLSYGFFLTEEINSHYLKIINFFN